MAIDVEVREIIGSNLGRRNMAVSFSEVLSNPDILMRAIVERIADEYVRNHYADIEVLIDPKVIAATVSVEMGARVTEQLQREIAAVMNRADAAYRMAKRK